MSEGPSNLDPEAIFTDTCVLYDYTVDEVPEAATLFDTYTSLSKYTSRFGYNEFTNVAERRAAACEAWERAVGEGEVSVGDYTFTEPSALREKDRSRLRELQGELVEECGEIEALRRINERRRQYERGSQILFGLDENDSIEAADDEGLVTILPDISYSPTLYSRFQMDIDNGSDCKILAEATEWYSSGGSDCFVTSDKTDFTESGSSPASSDDGEVLPGSFEEFFESPDSLQERINDHITRVYGGINHLWLCQLVEFVNDYEQ